MRGFIGLAAASTAAFILIFAAAEARASGPEDLFAAAKRGDTVAVGRLVRAGVDVNAVDLHGDSALEMAADNGRHEAADLLISLGANANNANIDGWTPLMSAAQRGHLAIVKRLVEAGADVNAVARITRTKRGTALDLAQSRGKPAVASYLESRMALGTGGGREARHPVDVSLESEVPSSMEDALARALDLLFAEVPEIAENDRATRRSHPGRVILVVEAVSDPAAEEEFAKDWFTFAEKYDVSDHVATGTRYHVHRDLDRVLVYDVVTDSRISLAEWRKGRK